MKKYLAITAALALALTACGQAVADSTPTPTAATEATAARVNRVFFRPFRLLVPPCFTRSLP